MAEFVYNVDEPRVYLAFGELKRGDVVTADEAPDGRFRKATKSDQAAVNVTPTTEA